MSHVAVVLPGCHRLDERQLGHAMASASEIASDLSLDGHTQRPIDSFRLDRFSEKVASPQLLI